MSTAEFDAGVDARVLIGGGTVEITDIATALKTAFASTKTAVESATADERFRADVLGLFASRLYSAAEEISSHLKGLTAA